MLAEIANNIKIEGNYEDTRKIKYAKSKTFPSRKLAREFCRTNKEFKLIDNGRKSDIRWAVEKK